MKHDTYRDPALLLSSPALGEEQSIYKTPRIPTEDEKVDASSWATF